MLAVTSIEDDWKLIEILQKYEMKYKHWLMTFLLDEKGILKQGLKVRHSLCS